MMGSMTESSFSTFSASTSRCTEISTAASAMACVRPMGGWPQYAFGQSVFQMPAH